MTDDELEPPSPDDHEPHGPDDSDAILMPPIPSYDTALMWGSYDHLARALAQIDAVTVDGLQLIRHELKGGTWHNMPPHLEGARLLLLADICTRISAISGIPLDYFRSQGDLPEAVPDDPGGLTGGTRRRRDW